MRKASSAYVFSVLVLIGVVALATACRRSQAESASASEPQYTTTATIKDLMQSIVDPSADVVWLSVTSVHSEQGVVDTAPKTDEEWTKVRHGAIALTEAANLLMVPGRHVARPGEKSETPGVELEPSEMEELINKDRASWIKRATALHEAGVAALQAVDAKNADKVFEIGAQIEMACENCHKQYWYPNEVIPPVEVNLK